MTKKNEGEWNDGTLEYWVKQKQFFLDFRALFHHFTTPEFSFQVLVILTFL